MAKVTTLDQVHDLDHSMSCWLQKYNLLVQLWFLSSQNIVTIASFPAPVPIFQTGLGMRQGPWELPTVECLCTHNLFHMHTHTHTVLRDINERGRDLDQVLYQYTEYVKPAFEEFTLPVGPSFFLPHTRLKFT